MSLSFVYALNDHLKIQKFRVERNKQVWGDPTTCLLSERQSNENNSGANIKRRKQVAG